uniref:Uncharacterized protein n=1 Tax=Aegilops tauschii subsp. strangulata TaxID=200361 RepID=A0A453MQ56_AEGTS
AIRLVFIILALIDFSYECTRGVSIVSVVTLHRLVG